MIKTFKTHRNAKDFAKASGKGDAKKTVHGPPLELAAFAYRHICENFGLRTIVTSTCWDIMFNLQLFAEDFPEIMRFSLFLRGVHKSEDLSLQTFQPFYIVNFENKWIFKGSYKFKIFCKLILWAIHV